MRVSRSYGRQQRALLVAPVETTYISGGNAFRQPVADPRRRRRPTQLDLNGVDQTDARGRVDHARSFCSSRIGTNTNFESYSLILLS